MFSGRNISFLDEIPVELNMRRMGQDLLILDVMLSTVVLYGYLAHEAGVTTGMLLSVLPRVREKSGKNVI